MNDRYTAVSKRILKPNDSACVHHFSHFDTNMTSLEAWTRDTIADAALRTPLQQACILTHIFPSSDQVFALQ
jgi:hypothetical protein